VKDSGYLTIEETYKKLGRPASWVKEQICEGTLGATLAGRRWLISPQDCDEILSNNPPASEPEKRFHNFLSDRPTRDSRLAQKDGETIGSARKGKASERSRKSLAATKNSRPRTVEDRRPTLTQKIKDLDRKFDRQSASLKSAMLEYRAAIRTGKQAKPPRGLIDQWKTARAELRHLVAQAEAKGLSLPTNLSIYKVLDQEDEVVRQKTAAQGDEVRTKAPVMIKGIDGYCGGSGSREVQEVRMVPAHVEARLIILRNRERAAAHSMRDRGKSQVARDVAAITWAQTRREAENLEREFQVVRRPI
jgi:hypothetical protein